MKIKPNIKNILIIIAILYLFLQYNSLHVDGRSTASSITAKEHELKKDSTYNKNKKYIDSVNTLIQAENDANNKSFTDGTTIGNVGFGVICNDIALNCKEYYIGIGGISEKFRESLSFWSNGKGSIVVNSEGIVIDTVDFNYTPKDNMVFKKAINAKGFRFWFYVYENIFKVIFAICMACLVLILSKMLQGMFFDKKIAVYFFTISIAYLIGVVIAVLSSYIHFYNFNNELEKYFNLNFAFFKNQYTKPIIQAGLAFLMAYIFKKGAKMKETNDLTI